MNNSKLILLSAITLASVVSINCNSAVEDTTTTPNNQIKRRINKTHVPSEERSSEDTTIKESDENLDNQALPQIEAVIKRLEDKFLILKKLLIETPATSLTIEGKKKIVSDKNTVSSLLEKNLDSFETVIRLENYEFLNAKSKTSEAPAEFSSKIKNMQSFLIRLKNEVSDSRYTLSSNEKMEDILKKVEITQGEAVLDKAITILQLQPYMKKELQAKELSSTTLKDLLDTRKKDNEMEKGNVEEIANLVENFLSEQEPTKSEETEKVIIQKKEPVKLELIKEELNKEPTQTPVTSVSVVKQEPTKETPSTPITKELTPITSVASVSVVTQEPTKPLFQVVTPVIQVAKVEKRASESTVSGSFDMPKCHTDILVTQKPYTGPHNSFYAGVQQNMSGSDSLEYPVRSSHNQRLDGETTENRLTNLSGGSSYVQASIPTARTNFRTQTPPDSTFTLKSAATPQEKPNTSPTITLVSTNSTPSDHVFSAFDMNPDDLYKPQPPTASAKKPTSNGTQFSAFDMNRDDL